MKRIKELMKQPVTWGGYVKLCLVCMIAGIIYSAAFIAYIYNIPTRLAGKIHYSNRFDHKDENLE